MCIRSRFVVLITALLSPASSALAEETAGTLSLNDGLSIVSFGDERIFQLDSSSRITFHFQEPSADGSIHFTITPADVSIPPLSVDGRELTYGLANPTTGTLYPEVNGVRRMSFSATVTATLAGEGGGAMTYSLPFTTESTSVTSADGTQTITVTGMRMIEGVWHVQLVGSTVNKDNAFPEPGTAVYTVLSGRFDRVP